MNCFVLELIGKVNKIRLFINLRLLEEVLSEARIGLVLQQYLKHIARSLSLIDLYNVTNVTNIFCIFISFGNINLHD